MRILLLLFALFLGHNSLAQFDFGELKYTGIGSYVMPAFHRLDDGTMIACQTFHSGHEMCGSNKYGGTKMALIRFDRDGNILWQKCYTKGSQKIVRIMPYPDGSIACLGYTNKELYGKGRATRFWIMLIDKDGNVKKEMVVDGGMKDHQETILAASVTPDGGFIGAGKVTVPSKRKGEEIEVDMYVIKVNHNAEILWEKNVNNAYWDRLSSIVPSKDGGYIAGGWCQYKGDKKKRRAGTAHIIRFSETGQIDWHKTYGTGHYDYISGLIEKDNGDIVFMGRETGITNIRHNSCGSQGFWISGLNSKGQLKWENFMVNRSSGTGSYSPSSALLTLDNGGYMVGGADLSNNFTSKLWMAEFGPKGKLVQEKNFGEMTCHGVYYIVPTAGRYLVAGWNQGYNTFNHETKEFGIHAFDTWTMDVSLEAAPKQKVPKEKIADSTVSQTIAYHEQENDDAPHLFVEIHKPEEKQIHVYPNPAREQVNIELSSQHKQIALQVYSANGKLQLESKATNTNLVTLNIGSLKRGTYLVVVQADGDVKRLKFVKE